MATKKEVTVRLETRELLYDASNKAHLAGRSRQAAGAGHMEAAYMQAGGDPSDTYQLRRSVSDAFRRAKAEISEYLSEGRSEADGLVERAVDEGEALELRLLTPSNFDESAVDGFAAAMHVHIRESALGDWFALSAPAEAKSHMEAAAAALAAALRALHSRRRPARPVYPEPEPGEGEVEEQDTDA